MTDNTLKSLNSEKNFEWTGSRTELVEVVEAILLLKSVNYGNITKREFYAYVGEVLNVDLSNHCKILSDMRNRKDDFSCEDRRIRYLPRMMEALSEKFKFLDNKQNR